MKLIDLELVKQVLMENLGEDLTSSLISIIKNKAPEYREELNDNERREKEELEVSMGYLNELDELDGKFVEKEVPTFDNSDVIKHHEEMLIEEEDNRIQKIENDSMKELEDPIEVPKPKKSSVPRDIVEEKIKMEFFIVLADSYKNIPDNLTGWVVQAEEGSRPESIIDKIEKAKDNYNNSKKGMKSPATSIGEAIEAVGPKYFKEEGISVKTKLPVWCVPME